MDESNLTDDTTPSNSSDLESDAESSSAAPESVASPDPAEPTSDAEPAAAPELAASKPEDSADSADPEPDAEASSVSSEAASAEPAASETAASEPASPETAPSEPEASADSAGPRSETGTPRASSRPEASSEPSFSQLDLPDFLMRALDEVGYETPSPIQSGAIPPLLEGRDLLGQAQTGTGKTAAFALPLLARISPEAGLPQVLVLTPTRELAIQVSEAFQRYASKMRGFRVLPIYGGQGYDRQLQQLRRGVHVVVGTPGRVMDHMRRGTLDLAQLKALVLDEADEMLRMGFREDVEWVLGHTSPERQIALFSATLPPEIRRIAGVHMNQPEEIRVKRKSATAETIRQRYWLTRGVHKLDALTRMLEVETFDGMIIFVRTKSATVTLAERLAARGFSAAPMNGDMPQSLREQTVTRMEKGNLDILVATDVAARGLDLDRISHVVNFDIPYDIDSYVHRVGRTGRAGRQGEAILFVAPRERRMLSAIEQVTRTRIERMELPTISDVNVSRVARFEERLTRALESGAGRQFQEMIEAYQTRHDVPGLEIASALASMLQGDQPFLLEERPEPVRSAAQRHGRGGPEPEGLMRYRVAVGRTHGASPGDLVGAIAGETGLEGRRIGRIEIRDEFSFIELPAGMPDDVHRHLQKVKVRGQALEISAMGPAGGGRDRRGPRPRPAGGPPRRQHQGGPARAGGGGAMGMRPKFKGPRQEGDPTKKGFGRKDRDRRSFDRKDFDRTDRERGGRDRRDFESREPGRRDSERREPARQDHGRKDYGQKDHGRKDHGRKDFDRKDYGRKDHDRKDYGRKDYDRKDDTGRAYARQDGPRKDGRKDYSRKDDTRKEPRRPDPRPESVEMKPSEPKAAAGSPGSGVDKPLRLDEPRRIKPKAADGEEGKRRVGKKARWSKERKRAAKKSKSKK